MSRRAFFSFHYELDVQRASIVRKSRLTHGEQLSFIDASLWEEAKRKNSDALRRLINSALENTSVTVVLIGSNTNQRQWVKFELQQSVARGNGIVGVRVNRLKNFSGQTTGNGINPLDQVNVKFATGNVIVASRFYKTYDYVLNDGYNNLGTWIEEAARLAGR